MSLFKELKRRNVIRVAIAYAVVSWVLIQIGNILFSTLELGPEPGKILLAILLLGFIPAVLFAWAFEITPEGIKYEKDVVRDESITNFTAKRLDMITIGLLIAAIGLFGLDRLMQQDDPIANNPEKLQTADSSAMDSQAESSKANEKSIAVLPFADMSQAGDQEYFADGISEEILNALVKASGLRVAGRTSSFSFKGKDNTIKQIGEALNVAHVLEGSVRKQGNKVRITAQLIKSDNESHLWSETYDGSLDNIFDLQENISRQVTEELKIILNLNADERLANKMTDNVDAYDLFLRGREYVAKRLDDNIPLGIELLHKAVELDPQFAEAWAVLAEAEVVSPGYLNTDFSEVDKRAISHAHKAIELNDQLALPYAVLALIKSSHGEHLDSLNDLKQALKLEPNNPVINRWLGIIYATLNRADLALPFYEKAYRLDPLSSANTFNLGSIHFQLGNVDQASRLFRITGDIRDSVILERSFIDDFQGNPQQARDNFIRGYESYLENSALGELVTKDEINILIQAMFGGTEQDKKLAQELNGMYLKDSDDKAYWQVMLHVAIGDIDRAYEILEAKPGFFHNFAPDVMWFPNESFKAFRADPRFAKLLLKQNLPQAWQEIAWPESCKPFAGTDGSDGQFSCE